MACTEWGLVISGYLPNLLVAGIKETRLHAHTHTQHVYTHTIFLSAVDYPPSSSSSEWSDNETDLVDVTRLDHSVCAYVHVVYLTIFMHTGLMKVPRPCHVHVGPYARPHSQSKAYS